MSQDAFEKKYPQVQVSKLNAVEFLLTETPLQTEAGIEQKRQTEPGTSVTVYGNVAAEAQTHIRQTEAKRELARETQW